ncbi:MAG: hypothetical protein Q9207_008370 [Kuettlingeria erythrocarpa]
MLQQSQMAIRAATSLRPCDNGPGNPIWESNMALMASSGQLTEEEFFMAEMETSDEDGPPSQMNQKTEIMMEELRNFQERERVESENIAAHQAAVAENLLTLNKKNATQEAFKAVLEEHLYKDMDRPDTLCTRRQVRDARAYMIHCGLDTAFLDGWALPSTDPVSPRIVSDDGIGAEHSLSVSLQEASGFPPALGGQASPSPSSSIAREPSRVEEAQMKASPANDTLPQDASTTDPLQTPSPGLFDLNHPFSASPHSASAYNAPPLTPQGPVLQYPLLAQNPAPASIPRSVPWPPTPPTPSMVTLPLPDSSGSDYEPQTKKRRPNIKKKQPVPPEQLALTSGNGVHDIGPATSNQETREFAMANPDHSSTTPSQEDSTIAVQLPEETSTSNGGSTPLRGGNHAQTKNRKSGRGRGRPKKSVG